jgi:hypothetical protein
VFRSLYRRRIHRLFEPYVPAAELDSVFEFTQLSQGECLRRLIGRMLPPSIWPYSPSELDTMLRASARR